MGFLVAFVAALLPFLPSCAAVCCSNLKPLCVFGGQVCQSNCPDGVTFCREGEVCGKNGEGDGWGACDKIVYSTINVDVLSLQIVTSYTATTQVYSTSTDVVLTTVFNNEDTFATTTITSASTITVTAPRSTVTLSARAQAEVVKRADVTQFVTVTDFNYCQSVNDPECTTIVQDVQTIFLTTTETSRSTITSNSVNLDIVSTTTWSVSTYTYTPDPVTVSGGEGNVQSPTTNTSPAGGLTSTSPAGIAPTSTTSNSQGSTSLAAPMKVVLVCTTLDAKCMAYLFGLVVGFHFLF